MRLLWMKLLQNTTQRKDAGKYKVLEDSVAKEKYVIGFRKDDKALCNEVVKQLKAMAKDGTLKKISEKWLMKTSQQSNN